MQPEQLNFDLPSNLWRESTGPQATQSESSRVETEITEAMKEDHESRSSIVEFLRGTEEHFQSCHLIVTRPNEVTPFYNKDQHSSDIIEGKGHSNYESIMSTS